MERSTIAWARMYLPGQPRPDWSQALQSSYLQYKRNNKHFWLPESQILAHSAGNERFSCATALSPVVPQRPGRRTQYFPSHPKPITVRAFGLGIAITLGVVLALALPVLISPL